jgi:hypothetical protein
MTVERIDIVRCRNRIDSFRANGFVKSAARKTAELKVLVEKAGPINKEWIANVMFGMEGTPEQLDEYLVAE